MAESILAIRQLHVWFRRASGDRVPAVQDVSLELSRGEIFGLVGESGCGKTTTLLATVGLLPPTAEVEGEVVFEGHELFSGGETVMRRHRWRDIAIVFQGSMNALNPVMRVGDQIVEPILVHMGTRKAVAQRQAKELLGSVGLESRVTDDYPYELSGGMRQRACIAMALACEPRILLADEPTTALDVVVQDQILELLVSLTAARSLGVLFVTHDMAVIADVCDRAAVMCAGKILEEGLVEDLYRSPQHVYTRLLFDSTLDIDTAMTSSGSGSESHDESMSKAVSPHDQR